MTDGECIYRKTVDYMFRTALEKDDFGRFSAIREFRVIGNWSLYYEHWLIVAAYNWNSFQSHLSRLDHYSSKFQNFARLFSTVDSFVPTTKPLIRRKKGV